MPPIFFPGNLERPAFKGIEKTSHGIPLRPAIFEGLALGGKGVEVGAPEKNSPNDFETGFPTWHVHRLITCFFAIKGSSESWKEKVRESTSESCS